MTTGQNILKMALGAATVAALVTAMAVFTATGDPDDQPIIVQLIGRLCFFGWWIPLVVGWWLGLLPRK
jgi:hypothetical protein